MAMPTQISLIASAVGRLAAAWRSWRNEQKQTKLLSDIAIARDSVEANSRRVELAAARIEAGGDPRSEINAVLEWQRWQDREDHIRYDASIRANPHTPRTPTTKIDLTSGKMRVER